VTRSTLFLFLSFLILIRFSATGQDFLVLQELFYANQPADSYFEALGIKTDYVVYQSAVGNPPIEDNVRRAARTAIGRSYESFVQLDIETMENDTKYVSVDSAKSSVKKMCELLRWFKSEAPSLKVGYYAFLPLTNIYAYSNRADSLAWLANNDLMQSLADSVDYLCPSLYAFYDDTMQYIRASRAIIREAKRLGKGKPVYPYISPQYHPSGSHPYQHVSKEYFALMLRSVKEAGADGVIIWGGAANAPSIGNWDATYGWWSATQEFLAGTGDNTFPTTRYTLEQNFPNPFNFATTIRFNVPFTSHVSIVVRDVLGQLVATLSNETRQAGEHEIVFDASGLASGVYFYTLRADQTSLTQKLVLLK
jgi:hypothetical protein